MVPRYRGVITERCIQAELADDFIELDPLGPQVQDLPETASNYNAGPWTQACFWWAWDTFWAPSKAQQQTWS